MWSLLYKIFLLKELTLNYIGRSHITPSHVHKHFFHNKIIKLWQVQSFVRPNLHVCTKYEDWNKKYAHNAYIAPYGSFLLLLHLCHISFLCIVFFPQSFDCLLLVCNNGILHFVHSFQMLTFLGYLKNFSY